MNRDCYKGLLSWKKASNRKPLILKGARQVGKTYLVELFARQEYENFYSLNFDANPKLASLFENEITPDKLIQKIEIYLGKKITPENSLLFFDEVQTCPRAITSLKYFKEQANEYHIIAAGSLLGLKLNEASSFPVGKVNFINMYPLTFDEFLEAVGKKKLREYLNQKNNTDPIEDVFHSQLLDLLKEYFITGGMPEVVDHYAKNKDILMVRNIQKEILNTYELDFAKHAAKSEVMKISLVWNSVPGQLAKENKKFIFSALKESGRGKDYEVAIQWLLDAGLIYKSFNVETAKRPLKAYVNHNIFKIYPLDIGLFSCLAELNPKIILDDDALFVEYKGSLTESYVAQEIKARLEKELCYWTSKGTAEIDFLIEKENNIYPLEVKAGINKKKKSLNVFSEKYGIDHLLRTTARNFKLDGKIMNYPLYAVSKVGL